VQARRDGLQLSLEPKRAALYRVNDLHEAGLIVGEGRQDFYPVQSTRVMVEPRAHRRLRSKEPDPRLGYDCGRLGDHIEKRDAHGFSQIRQEGVRGVAGHGDEACPHSFELSGAAAQRGARVGAVP